VGEDPRFKAQGQRHQQVIRVDRDNLLQFMQFRLKAFQLDLVAEKLDVMPPDQRQRLIEDYVREEVLYREALALGLDRNDYVLKQRIIQRVEFALRGLVEDSTQLSEEEIHSFYVQHKGNYSLDPAITFTHVFFSSDSHGRKEALNLANAQLKSLREDHTPFPDATQYGDRFLYHTNYVERNKDYVESHFGKKMTDAIFALNPSAGNWSGPFQSPFGFHLTQVATRSDRADAEFSTIRQRVAEDARRNYIDELLEANIQDLIQNYNIELDTGL